MPSKLQLLPADIRTRLEALSEVASSVEGLNALWLFGSFARGDATPISDVDLAYLPDETLSGEALGQFETRLYSTIARALRTDEFALVDLGRAPAYFAWQVLREGRPLHCRRPAAVVQLAEQTYGRAPDENSLRRRGNTQFLETLEMAEPQIDRERVIEFLRLLSDDLRILREKAQVSGDVYRGSRDLQAIVERRLQTAIESCINIGNHLIARLRFRVPSDYADVFQVLGESKLLPRDLAERMMDMARFRNLLVHVYWGIDQERVHASLQARLAALEDFARHIAAWLKKQGTETGT